MEFDENEAVAYMRQVVDPTISAKYPDDDELINLIDIIFDYFDYNFDDDDLESDESLDLDDLMGFVSRMLKKDSAAVLSDDDARRFVEAYLEYESTLDEK